MAIDTDTWTDGGADGIYATAANWDVAKPTNGDTAIIGSSARDITGTPDQSAITDVELHVTERFTGTLMTQGSPLHLGTAAGADCYIKSLKSSSVNIYHDLCDNLYVLGTSVNPHALYIANGTYTNVYVASGYVTIASAATVTNLFILGSGAHVTIQSGATVTTIYTYAGMASCLTAFTTLYNRGGTFEHIGVAKNIATVNCDAGLVVLKSVGATFTKLNVYGGRIDATQEGRAFTVTDADVWPGAVYDARNGGTIVETNVPVEWGSGVYHGYASAIRRLPMTALGG